jgi:excisionase family DNA binding protein
MLRYDRQEKTLTVAEVADILHVHPNTLRRWTDEGKIAHYRITERGDRRFKLTDVENFLAGMNPYRDSETGKRGDNGMAPLF